MIFRSTDPTTWDDVDGIIINESAPAPNVKGVAANVAIVVGQTERGPSDLTEVGSIGEFFELFGKSNYGVNLALKNKKFGRLKVARVTASAAVVASKAFNHSSTPIITFSAKQGAGLYGNSITVKIDAGSTQGSKYTILDGSANPQFGQEVYDNVLIANASTAFAASNLVTAAVNATTFEPDTAAATALISGADGTVADTDYQTALARCAVENSGNIIFLDSYNTARNGYVLAHIAATSDKMGIVCGAEGDSRSTAVTDAASYRDTDGRIIYGYNWVQTSIDGVLTYTNPASWIASIFSQCPPYVDLSFVDNAQFMTGATGLKQKLARTDYVLLKNAGISAFQLDADIGFTLVSSVVTQIINDSKTTILRRRMADYLTTSAARYLKNYQNAVNSKANRDQVKGALLSFIQGQEQLGILPRDSDVNGGAAKLVDTESQNTSNSIAQGFFKILWRQRIFSAMRYIVLSAEIGQSVVVTDQ